METVDELANGMTSTLAISDAEAFEVVGIEELGALKAERFLLGGKLLTSRSIHKESFIGTMKKIWHTREVFTAVQLDDSFAIFVLFQN